MNLILLFPADFQSATAVKLTGRRLEHARSIQRVEVGAVLRVGQVGGALGTGRVTEITERELSMQVELINDPPAALPVTLVLGLPRPRMLKRTLQTVTAMGVKELYLINSFRVEKSYWQTPLLTQEGLLEHLTLGLEQAIDTVLPTVHLKKLFKPFVEDELPTIAKGTRGLVAHPYQATPLPTESNEATTLAIGPEGGFIDYEIHKLAEAGLAPVHIGGRILRVENAVPVLLGKLFPIS
jgi:RsmE family RNA methyltransferase